ncbi:YqgE/AlgH family protein [Marinobacterium arenosum]|uniref:YqgE/AlgH family protein n=1 Tax=Marinobacterium arenosum TaxID=2862496 RepID=UPI001C9733DD|nr:YqgE/AlgH family protein [Marinobacterium arenosum]MBY4678355.1 YqgE/AlgH family protein [Marinobacterium arenosum]
MSESTTLKGHFLLSMPHMQDPFFAQSLTYICEHDSEGAMGIIINRPLDFDLPALFRHLDLEADPAVSPTPVYAGGPVAMERGFILHPSGDEAGHWTSTLELGDGVSLTSSMDILEAMAHNRGPQKVLVALGYAGWSAGQLEDEITRNTWLSCPANLDIMFSTPAENRLQAAAALLGIDLSLLTAHSGHA